MKVWTTRSGQVLHGSPSCPRLPGPRFALEDEDALPHARRCTHSRCELAFLRAPRETKAA